MSDHFWPSLWGYAVLFGAPALYGMCVFSARRLMSQTADWTDRFRHEFISSHERECVAVAGAAAGLTIGMLSGALFGWESWHESIITILSGFTTACLGCLLGGLSIYFGGLEALWLIGAGCLLGALGSALSASALSAGAMIAGGVAGAALSCIPALAIFTFASLVADSLPASSKDKGQMAKPARLRRYPRLTSALVISIEPYRESKRGSGRGPESSSAQARLQRTADVVCLNDYRSRSRRFMAPGKPRSPW
jgi:hypothetical protein